MHTLLLLCYVATWATIPHLLLLRKRPVATLAWLGVILFIPGLGAIAYCTLGAGWLKRGGSTRHNLFAGHASRRPVPAGPTADATSALLQARLHHDRQFLPLLSRINQLPVSSAGNIQFLNSSAELYPALEQRIREARHHIHLVFYIWPGDLPERRMLQLLTEAARRGVIVRLLLDGVGSHGFSENLLVEYRRAGGQFSWFQSLDPKRLRFFMNLRNHRKLQIIDGNIAFVGGMNAVDECAGPDTSLGHWRDAQMEVINSIVAELQEIFADVAAILERDFDFFRKIEPTTSTRPPFWQKFSREASRPLSRPQ